MTLPGLPVQRNSETPDVRIQLKNGWAFPATLPSFGEDFHSGSDGVRDSQPNLRAGLFPGGEYFGFFYGDGARFAVERHGREVWADWLENYTFEDACTYLLGPVMGFVLRLCGTLRPHGTSVICSLARAAIISLRDHCLWERSTFWRVETRLLRVLLWNRFPVKRHSWRWWPIRM